MVQTKIDKRAATVQQTDPMHIENTVMQLGKRDLNINNAFATYRDMKLDGVVSGSVSFIKSLITKGGFTLTPHKDSTKREREVVEALNKSLDSMVYDKKTLLSNWVQVLDYGCSLNEVVFKKEGNTFVFDNISPIHLSSVSRFEFNGGRLEKLHLHEAENDGLVVNKLSTNQEVSGDKVLFFRIEPDSDFPLGKSLLYGAYTAWKTKKILQEYEAIGVAKNLSGVLDIKVPSDYINKYFSEPNSDEGIYISNLLSQAEMLHAGKGSYILSASDTNANGVRLFEITTVGGGGGNAQNYNVGQAINRYNQEIQLSLQTSVLSLGAEGGGSFALSDNSTYLMTLFIENIRSVIANEFKKALKLAFTLNNLSTERIPVLTFDKIEPLNWEEFTRGWQRLLQSGGVTPTEGLEAFLRERGEAPEADYDKVLRNPKTVEDNERTENDKQL